MRNGLILLSFFTLISTTACSSSGDGSGGDTEMAPGDDSAGGDDGAAAEPGQGDAPSGSAGSAAPGANEPAGDDEPGRDEPDSGEGAAAGDDALAFPDPRGGCSDLDTRFLGDDACIAPPAPDEGFQIHIGPEDYDEEAEVAQFILRPGEETSQCWTYHTPNQEDIYYSSYVFSGRPGTHHVFNSMLSVEVEDGGGFKVCVDSGLGNSSGRVGGLPGAGRAYVARQPIAPENEKLGSFVAANTPAEADMHYFNFTEDDILREFWLNVYYIDADEVEDTVKVVRGMGGLSWTAAPIAPGTDQVYRYECPFSADGRLIGIAGHYHAHGVRETAHIRRADGTRFPIFEMYDYNDQATFAFDSITDNPEFTGEADFGHTGMLEVSAGDVLEWECHIINDSDVPLRYTNSVHEGEMCNIFAGYVGPGGGESCIRF